MMFTGRNTAICSECVELSALIVRDQRMLHSARFAAAKIAGRWPEEIENA